MRQVWLLAEREYGTCGIIYSGFCKHPDSQSLKRGLMQLCISHLGCFLHEWRAPWHLHYRGSSSCTIRRSLTHYSLVPTFWNHSQAVRLVHPVASVAIWLQWPCLETESWLYKLASSRDRHVGWDTASSSCWRGQTHSALKIREISKVFCMNGDFCLPMI